MTTTESTTPSTAHDAPLTRTVDGREVPQPGTYVLDASHTEAGFQVRHLMVSKVRGRFAEVRGTVTIAEEPGESAVEVTIATASIDSRDEGRDTHLRSADFLDVETHPEMTYRSTRVTPAADGSWSVEGDLTIRGVTRPVPLSVTFEGAARDPWGGSALGFSATTEFDREDFGLTWNQSLETGGVLVGRTVKVAIEAEAVPAEVA